MAVVRRPEMNLEKQAAALYDAYPRKVARGAGVKAALRVLRSGVPIEELLEAVREYATSRIDENGNWRDERKYTPHCSTWMNQERWTDDREEWFPHEVDAVASWESVRKAISRHGRAGRLQAVEDMPAEVMTAAQKVGWFRLCDMTEFNREGLFRQFETALKKPDQ